MPETNQGLRDEIKRLLAEEEAHRHDGYISTAAKTKRQQCEDTLTMRTGVTYNQLTEESNR